MRLPPRPLTPRHYPPHSFRPHTLARPCVRPSLGTARARFAAVGSQRATRTPTASTSRSSRRCRGCTCTRAKTIRRSPPRSRPRGSARPTLRSSVRSQPPCSHRPALGAVCALRCAHIWIRLPRAQGTLRRSSSSRARSRRRSSSSTRASRRRTCGMGTRAPSAGCRPSCRRTSTSTRTSRRPTTSPAGLLCGGRHLRGPQGGHKRRLDLAKRTDKAMGKAYGGDFARIVFGPESTLEGVCAAARPPPLLPDEVRRRLEHEKKFTSPRPTLAWSTGCTVTFSTERPTPRCSSISAASVGARRRRGS